MQKNQYCRTCCQLLAKVSWVHTYPFQCRLQLQVISQSILGLINLHWEFRVGSMYACIHECINRTHSKFRTLWQTIDIKFKNTIHQYNKPAYVIKICCNLFMLCTFHCTALYNNITFSPAHAVLSWEGYWKMITQSEYRFDLSSISAEPVRHFDVMQNWFSFLVGRQDCMCPHLVSSR